MIQIKYLNLNSLIFTIISYPNNENYEQCTEY